MANHSAAHDDHGHDHGHQQSFFQRWLAEQKAKHASTTPTPETAAAVTQ